MRVRGCVTLTLTAHVDHAITVGSCPSNGCGTDTSTRVEEEEGSDYLIDTFEHTPLNIDGTFRTIED